jgi:hypothetical protein
MIKICFLYEGETNERFLNILKKMTPNQSGVWKEMVGVSNVGEADWCVVLDMTNQPIPIERTIFVSAHPKMENYIGYYDNTKRPHRLDNAETFGFGEWWIKYDYDYLSALEPMKKTNDVCCIMSNAGGSWNRDRRKVFMKEFEKKYPINLYGRIRDAGKGELGKNTPTEYWFGKEPVLEAHRYSVEIDHGPCKNYFSERLFDSLLLWCMPLCWGCDNVHDFIPEKAFRYIDIMGNGDDIINYAESDEREKNMDAIAEARNLLLNKYQIWAWVYEYLHKIGVV